MWFKYKDNNGNVYNYSSGGYSKSDMGGILPVVGDVVSVIYSKKYPSDSFLIVPKLFCQTCVSQKLHKSFKDKPFLRRE